VEWREREERAQRERTFFLLKEEKKKPSIGRVGRECGGL